MDLVWPKLLQWSLLLFTLWILGTRYIDAFTPFSLILGFSLENVRFEQTLDSLFSYQRVLSFPRFSQIWTCENPLLTFRLILSHLVSDIFLGDLLCLYWLMTPHYGYGYHHHHYYNCCHGCDCHSCGSSILFFLFLEIFSS